MRVAPVAPFPTFPWSLPGTGETRPQEERVCLEVKAEASSLERTYPSTRNKGLFPQPPSVPDPTATGRLQTWGPLFLHT